MSLVYRFLEHGYIYRLALRDHHVLVPLNQKKQTSLMTVGVKVVGVTVENFSKI